MTHHRTPRRLALFAAATAAAATTAAMIALAQRGDASPTQRQQFALHASSPTTSALFVPCGECFVEQHPVGAHIGGTELDSGVLTDATGHAIGHFALQSVGITPFGPNGPGELQLTATLVIDGDQLIGEGLEEPPLNGGTAAITGGTGRFRGARGEIRYHDNPDNSTNLTIDLNP